MNVPPDHYQRVAAVTTFDKNVVVVAGAGTGKTAVLISKMAVYLLGESYRRDKAKPDEKRVDELLALTFTEKAAAEMGERLLEFLRKLAVSEEESDLDGPVFDLVANPLMTVYGLSRDLIGLRAKAALEHVDRIETSTIHSFCASLLRSFPLEASLSPEFVVDTDNTLLEETVDRLWEAHAKPILRNAGGLPDGWRMVFDAGLTLNDFRQFIVAMTASTVPTAALLDARSLIGDAQRHRQRIRATLPTLGGLAARLLAYQFPQKHKIAQFTDALRGIAEMHVDKLASGLRADESIRALLKTPTEKLLTKTACQKLGSDVADVAGEIESARGFLLDAISFQPAVLGAIHRICAPVVARGREVLKQQGIVPYNHLLLYGAELLQQNSDVAKRLRSQYQLILLDEVQDTDPLQFDIVKPMRTGSHREPGWGDTGSFVVGDPKQSIYLFRGADTEAFSHEVKLLEKENSQLIDITANFRSDPRIISFVNAVGGRLFRLGEHPPDLQPPYVPLTASVEESEESLPVRVIRYGVAGMSNARPNVDELARVEAEIVTRHLIQCQREGREWRDLAVLMPTRNGSDELISALQRQSVPFVFSGTKTFYRRQEVVDTVNFLVSLLDPGDKGALFAFLGSLVGGVSNEALVVLAENRLGEKVTYLDAVRDGNIEQHEVLAGIQDTERAHVGRVLCEMTRLHEVIHEKETWEAFTEIRKSFPVVEAWAYHPMGGQKTANVHKTLRTIEEAVTGGESLTRVVRRIARDDLLRGEDEESSLGSASTDAVRVDTIHGAKGLEFEVVLLVNLFRRFTARSEEPVYVMADQGVGSVAAGLRGYANEFARGYLERQRQKEHAERARLLYVAMTRAKEQLHVLLPAAVADGKTFKASHAGMLWAGLVDAEQCDELVSGREFVWLDTAGWPEERRVAERVDRAAPFSVNTLIEDVEQRRTWHDRIIGTQIRITPSSGDEPFPRRDTADEATKELEQLERDTALRFGDLCHAALEHLDMSRPEEDLEEVIASPLIKRLAGDLYEELLPELRAVLAEAIRAEFFRETIIAADELYRELPILEQVNGATLSGRIDLAARIGDRWIVVDFKTDREMGTHDELLARYGGQKTAYVGALRRALELEKEPAFYLYFLRFCEALQL